jgi:NADH dehydrogenase (ubiquinone) 1 alpha subcomplex subunit 9
MGSQVLVPFRGSDDDPRHLKLMGDLGQVEWWINTEFFIM